MLQYKEVDLSTGSGRLIYRSFQGYSEAGVPGYEATIWLGLMGAEERARGQW